MFDMGFLEIMVVAFIGLVVIGPARLPGAIKTCAIWISGIKRNISAARTEFEKQIGADEIRREIHNEEVMASLKAAKDKQEEMRRQISSGDYSGVFNKSPQTDADENRISPGLAQSIDEDLPDHMHGPETDNAQSQPEPEHQPSIENSNKPSPQ